jgi:hypothetical protein
VPCLENCDALMVENYFSKTNHQAQGFSTSRRITLNVGLACKEMKQVGLEVAILFVLLCDGGVASEGESSKQARSFADLWDITPAEIFGSEERARELMSAEDGAMLSNGRTLSWGVQRIG